MCKQTVTINNLKHEAVGGACLDVIQNPSSNDQLVVMTEGQDQGVQTTMNDVQYFDFTVLSAEEEIAAGLKATILKDGITLRTLHQGAQILVDMTALAAAGVEQVVLETFEGLTPSGGPVTLQPASISGYVVIALADEDPPDTIYYYQNGDGSWGWGYDWYENANVTLDPEGTPESVVTDLLRLTIQVPGSPVGGPVEFSIISSNPEAGTFLLNYEKLIPILPPASGPGL